MRGATAQIVDALPELGGQLTALYPEKYIFDVAGFPKVLAKDLVKSLRAGGPVQRSRRTSGQRVTGLARAGRPLRARDGARDRFPTRAIIIAAGIGAFSPRRLPQAMRRAVVRTRHLRRRDRPAGLSRPARRDHRRRRLGVRLGDAAGRRRDARDARASERPLPRARRDGDRSSTPTSPRGRASLFTFHELADVIEHAEGERFSHIVLKDIKAKTTREIEADVVLPMLGFVSDIGPIAEWGLTLEKDEIVVNQVDGDRTPGDLGGGRRHDVSREAQADRLRLRRSGDGGEPGGALDLPGEEGAPGHSSNMAIFGQKDD